MPLRTAGQLLLQTVIVLHFFLLRLLRDAMKWGMCMEMYYEAPVIME